MSNDERAKERDERETTILLYAEMMPEAQALGGGLLDHDADESRFRAALIAAPAHTYDHLLDAMLAHPSMIIRSFVVTHRGTWLCRPSG